ncbi:MAG: hypothetical protein MUF49_28545, partial [Oculatellaceae cyanobacterium Prado106]|nr:hypothetical protein [Oculatellaceae cyanobacterium Prado106]
VWLNKVDRIDLRKTRLKRTRLRKTSLTIWVLMLESHSTNGWRSRVNYATASVVMPSTTYGNALEKILRETSPDTDGHSLIAPNTNPTVN